MGRGMVKNLVEKGDFTAPLAIYNRTTARSEKLTEALPPGKTKVVKSIEDAVAAADINPAVSSSQISHSDLFDPANPQQQFVPQPRAI